MSFTSISMLESSSNISNERAACGECFFTMFCTITSLQKKEDNVGSRVDAILNANGQLSRFQFRIGGYLAPRRHGGSSYRTPNVGYAGWRLDFHRGGASGSGWPLRASRRQSSRTPNVSRHSHTEDNYTASRRHRASGSRCRFYTPRRGMRAPAAPAIITATLIDR